MQPKLIKMDKLYITGLTGDGAKTSEVWNEFDKQYYNNPFPKDNKNGYEIRFYNGEKSVVSGIDIHVGFATTNTVSTVGFSTITLPATDFAVFKVLVENGYDSGNAEMNKWLADNSTQYKQLMFDGLRFIVECYNEKFKGGDKPDSIVELWIPVQRICQSCFMPMTRLEDFGDNSTYCRHCYAHGALRGGMTMEELTADIHALIDIEAEHPNLLSSPLFDFIKEWLLLGEVEKSITIPELLSKLVDGQDCWYMGTPWENEWLADGAVCHCIACVAARKCISDIKLMEESDI